MECTSVMCSWTPHCENMNCPHRYPHTPYPSPSKNVRPQCEDKNVFCYSENKQVNCVPVIESREGK